MSCQRRMKISLSHRRTRFPSQITFPVKNCKSNNSTSKYSHSYSPITRTSLNCQTRQGKEHRPAPYSSGTQVPTPTTSTDGGQGPDHQATSSQKLNSGHCTADFTRTRPVQIRMIGSFGMNWMRAKERERDREPNPSRLQYSTILGRRR